MDIRIDEDGYLVTEHEIEFIIPEDGSYGLGMQVEKYKINTTTGLFEKVED